MWTTVNEFRDADDGLGERADPHEAVRARAEGGEHIRGFSSAGRFGGSRAIGDFERVLSEYWTSSRENIAVPLRIIAAAPFTRVGFQRGPLGGLGGRPGAECA